jgi:ABC-2 type transport system permease protein
VADLAIFTRLARAQIRGQLSYRSSFLMNCVGQALAQANDLVVILIVFGRVASLGGFDIRAVLLFYALSGCRSGWPTWPWAASSGCPTTSAPAPSTWC